MTIAILVLIMEMVSLIVTIFYVYRQSRSCRKNSIAKLATVIYKCWQYSRLISQLKKQQGPTMRIPNDNFDKIIEDGYGGIYIVNVCPQTFASVVDVTF